MKWFALFVMMTMTTVVEAQRFQPDRPSGVAAGVSGGYASRNYAVGNLSIGWMSKGSNHFSINLGIPAKVRAADIPVIGEARIGHVFGAVELYGGIGYHCASTDGDKYISEYVNGWKPGYGIIFKFPQTPFTLGAGMSGKIFSIQAGLFGVR